MLYRYPFLEFFYVEVESPGEFEHPGHALKFLAAARLE
jgi:hypothetical protein